MCAVLAEQEGCKYISRGWVVNACFSDEILSSLGQTQNDVHDSQRLHSTLIASIKKMDISLLHMSREMVQYFNNHVQY